jgi:opacity protein-like surface antigen
VLAGATLGGTGMAQQSSGSSAGGGSSGSGGSAPASDEGAASAFGTPSGGTPAPAPAREAAPALPSTPAPESAEPGTGGTAAPPESATFSLPSATGGGALETIRIPLGGMGRPRYRFSASAAVGFDDNIFGTPTKQQEFPEQRVTVVLRPEQDVQVPVFGVQFVNGIRRPVIVGFRTERLPALTEEVVIPGQKTEPRESSLVARSNVGLEVQFASRRTLFTLDGRVGAEYTAARDRDPTQYFGTLGVRFVHKLAPRLQWNASVDANYGNQPDLSRANTPTTVTTGSYLDLIARTGLEYRWTPRITTAANISYRSLTFSDTNEQSNDYQAYTYSVEGRYLWSPRLTVLGELRYGTTSYANDVARDSGTTFLLTGADWKVTNRLQAAFRAGVAMRDTDTAGTSLSPYLEMNVGYRLARASQLQYVVSYGFDEPSDASSEVVTLRNGLSYIQYFTPRLRAVASSNVVYSTTTNTGTDDSVTQLAFDANLGLEYNLNRRWTFTGTYSFTTVFSDNEFAEYYRNRLFLGLQYAF